MRWMMVLLMAFLFVLGGTGMGYAYADTDCPYDGLIGMWTGRHETVDGRMYMVYRCHKGHEYLYIPEEQRRMNDDGCPFDGMIGIRTNDSRVVDGKMYDIYRCPRGHEYVDTSQSQLITPSPDYQAGLAIGSVLGELLKGAKRSVRSDNDDDINKEYDLSKVKTIFIVAFPDPNYSHSVLNGYICEAAGQWCKTILEDELKDQCPEILVDGAVVRQMLEEEYDKYAAEGGNLSEADFKTATICNYADLLVSIKTENLGRDPQRAWCDAVIVALDAKTGENVFSRKEERVHTNKSSKIYTEKDVLYKTVYDYTEKLAKLIKRSSK